MQTKFKQTEIGEIPEDWKVVSFNVIIAGKPRHGLYKPDEFFGSGVKIVKMGSHNTHDFIDANMISDRVKLSPEELKKYRLTERDLLFLRTSLVFEGTGKCSYIRTLSEPMAFVSNLLAVSIEPEQANPLFYYYYFVSKIGRQRILSICEQTAASTLRSSDLNLLKLPIFPVNEQEKIAKVLFDLDSQIEVLQQQNETLESIGKALFKHWFIDFEYPNEQGKPYKSSGGKMVESEFGEIPEGWEIGVLGKEVKVIKGVSYSSSDLQRSKNALVTLKSMNRGGGLNKNGFKEYIGEYKKEQIIIDGDIVVAYTDLTQKAEVIGKPAIVNKPSDYDILIASLDLSIIRPTNLTLNNPFIYYLLCSENFQNHVCGYTNGTTVLHLDSMVMNNYIFVKPDSILVKKFGQLIQMHLNQKKINEEKIVSLIEIRDSLLPKLMSGKIRVPAGVRA
jgi:type I restriction enzyme S subunit